MGKGLRMNFGADTELRENLEKLKKIYNINTYTVLIRHIVDLELIRHNIK